MYCLVYQNAFFCCKKRNAANTDPEGRGKFDGVVVTDRISVASLDQSQKFGTSVSQASSVGNSASQTSAKNKRRRSSHFSYTAKKRISGVKTTLAKWQDAIVGLDFSDPLWLLQPAISAYLLTIFFFALAYFQGLEAKAISIDLMVGNVQEATRQVFNPEVS